MVHAGSIHVLPHMYREKAAIHQAIWKWQPMIELPPKQNKNVGIHLPSLSPLFNVALITSSVRSLMSRERQNTSAIQESDSIHPKYVNLSSLFLASLAVCFLWFNKPFDSSIFVWVCESFCPFITENVLQVVMLTDNHCLNIISQITRALETVICLEYSYKAVLQINKYSSTLLSLSTNLNWYQSWFNLTWLLWHSQTTLEHFVFKNVPGIPF